MAKPDTSSAIASATSTQASRAAPLIAAGAHQTDSLAVRRPDSVTGRAATYLVSPSSSRRWPPHPLWPSELKAGFQAAIGTAPSLPMRTASDPRRASAGAAVGESCQPETVSADPRGRRSLSRSRDGLRDGLHDHGEEILRANLPATEIGQGTGHALIRAWPRSAPPSRLRRSPCCHCAPGGDHSGEQIERNRGQLRATRSRSTSSNPPRHSQILPDGGRGVAGSNPVSPIETPCKCRCCLSGAKRMRGPIRSPGPKFLRSIGNRCLASQRRFWSLGCTRSRSRRSAQIRSRLRTPGVALRRPATTTSRCREALREVSDDGLCLSR